jgi:hypothetical protein
MRRIAFDKGYLDLLEWVYAAAASSLIMHKLSTEGLYTLSYTGLHYIPWKIGLSKVVLIYALLLKIVLLSEVSELKKFSQR